MSDTNDNFDWAALEADLGEQPIDVIDVTKFDNVELLDRFNQVNNELRTISELHIVRTDRGRELQSLRAALRITLADRGLM